MFERLSEKSIRVVMNAQEETRRLNQNRVNTEHLLLGIMRVEDDTVFPLLSSMNITLEKLRNEAELLSKKENAYIPMEIPFTDRAKDVLYLADIYAKRNPNIEPKHIFKAILFYKNKDDTAVKLLENLGADCETLEEALA